MSNRAIGKLLRRIDNHVGSVEGEDSLFLEQMIRKFDRGEDLELKEIFSLKRILEELDTQIEEGIDES